MTSFGPNDIKIGEAIHRAEAHLGASCELYASGRKPDALLQAARPATDLLPWLEVELRSSDAELREFFTATAQIGASIRRNDKPRALRKAMRQVEKAGEKLLRAVLPDVAEESASQFRASIAIALLKDVPVDYRASVEDGDLGRYQSAYALTNWATEMLHDGHDGRIESLNKLVRSLGVVFPGPEPPSQLVQPDDVAGLVREIEAAAVAELGAVRIEWELTDSLRQVARLLGDVVESYERGQGPLAARLAASLFIRSYDPIREEFQAADPTREERLTQILGIDLRMAINEGAASGEIVRIAREARGLLVPDDT